MDVNFRQVDWTFATPFRIAYRSQICAETVHVELKDENAVGRAEGMCVSYHGETIGTLLAQLAAVRSDLAAGLSRTDLQNRMSPGGARNAVDCAMWDLEAKRAGRRAWELAGIAQVRPLRSAYTLTLDTPQRMAEAAATAARQYSLLKLKLSGEEDVERVAAVRRVCPNVDLIVDANQSWSEAQLHTHVPQLARMGVQLIEQPLAVGKDDALATFDSQIPLCADESCQTADSISALVGKYAFVNIKLDKTGGLTEALRLARSATNLGFKLMVGCMAGSSLSMAPAFIVGQLCTIVDLDGPLLSTCDVPNGIRYDGSWMYPPEPTLWG